MGNPYEACKVLGPFGATTLRRKKVEIINDQGISKQTNYSRYLMEVHLGRILAADEEVHHIDENYFNDSIENLEVISKIEHVRHHKTLDREETFTCSWCLTRFTLRDQRYSIYLWNKKNTPKYNGPFCCQSHANSYSNYKRWHPEWTGWGRE